MSIGATEPFVFEFQPPPPEDVIDYYDPFILNEDGTVDLDINGKARIRGERLRVDGRLRVLGNAVVEENLEVKGFITGNFAGLTLQGTTTFGSNTIVIDSEDNSITGVGTITANDVSTSSISGITTITPVTELNVNGGLIVTGVSTVGLASTSNLIEDSTLTFELVDDTTLVIKVRGTDGVIRSANISLS
jgi:hypothetical protein